MSLMLDLMLDVDQVGLEVRLTCEDEGLVLSWTGIKSHGRSLPWKISKFKHTHFHSQSRF